MKRSGWLYLADLLIAAACIAFIVYGDKRKTRRQKLEEKLDTSLEDTFPASDPVAY